MKIINAKIYTADNNKVIENGFVEIEGTKIKSIGNMLELNGKEDDQETLDIKGGLMFPGFVDAHCHLGLYEDSLAFEGEDCNESTDPTTPQLRAADGINMKDRCFAEARRYGVTTVAVAPGSANPIGGQIACLKTYGNVIEEALISVNIGTKFALGENPKKQYDEKDSMPITRMGIAAIIREQLFKAQKYAKDKKSKGADLDYDFKCESLLPLLEGKTKAHFHAHRGDDICTAIRIAKEFSLDYVIVHGTGAIEVADYLKKENVKIIVGPLLTDRSKPELKDLTNKSPAILNRKGIKTTLCTDHPVIPIQCLPLHAMLAVKNGQKEEDALNSITITAAEFCGTEKRVGSISVGKDADLVIFQKHPFYHAFEEPQYVFINGRKVVDFNAVR